jgi:hypothetical protein
MDSVGNSINNDFSLPPVPSSASAAMITPSAYDGDRFSERTGVYWGVQQWLEEYHGTSIGTEIRGGYSAGEVTFLHPNVPSHRPSSGRYGNPSPYMPSSPSTFSVATTHGESSVSQFESCTPTFGMEKWPSLPTPSVGSFDEISLPPPPSTPLPSSVYSEDGHHGRTIADPHTRHSLLDY